MICNRYLLTFLPLISIRAHNTELSPITNTIPYPPCKSYYNSSLKKKVYTNVEIEPGFPGGEAAFQRFLNRNLKYPQEQIDSGELQSTVVVKFVVDVDGQIKDLRVQSRDRNKDSSELTPLDREVVRVYNSTPTWTPGICNGKNVAVELKRPLIVHPEIEE